MFYLYFVESEVLFYPPNRVRFRDLPVQARRTGRNRVTVVVASPRGTRSAESGAGGGMLPGRAYLATRILYQTRGGAPPQ